MSNLITQLIGVVAVVFSITVWQVKKRRVMLLLKMMASLLFAVHFLLLSAYTGSGMNVVNMVRFFVFSNKEDHGWAARKIWVYLFILVSWLVGVFTWQGYISLFPLVGTTIGIITFWQSDTGRMRGFALLVSPLWFVYNVVVSSYPGMVIQALLFLSGVVGILRFGIADKESES